MKFTDDRAKPEKIGAIRNALGGTAKGLVTTDDLGMILAEATTDALRKAGIDADLNLDRTANDSVPADEMKGYDSAFGGRLTEIHVESNPGWNTVKITARVVIDVCVISGGKREWIGPIDGTAERRELNQIDAQSLTLALDSALQNCMRNMVRHLKASGGVEMLKGQ